MTATAVTDERRLPRVDRGRDGATLVGLALILAFAAFLRVRYTDEFGSFDELWNLALTTGHGTPFGQFGTDVIEWHPRSQTSLVDALPAWHIWNTLDLVLHPPLYLVTLRAWRALFGEGDWPAHAYSIVWSLGAIVLAFGAIRETLGRSLALAAALIMAVAPTQVYYGQEIRSYSMLTAIGCGALWLMTRIETRGPTRRLALALGVAPFAMLMVHYFAFGSAIAMVAFGAWRLREHRRPFLVTVAVTAVVYAIIWLPFALRQVHALDTGDSFTHVAHRSWSRELIFLVGGPIRQLIDRPFDQDRVMLLTGVVLVAPWFLIRRLPGLRPWAMWLCGTLGGLLLLDAARDSEQIAYVRYTAAATPAVLPLMIGAAWAARRWAGWAMAGLLLLASAIYLNANIGVAADSPGFGGIARAVAARVGPGDAIVTYRGSSLKYAGEVIQLHLSHQPGLFPRPIVDLSRPMTQALTDQLPRRVWLIGVATEEPIDVIVPGARTLWGRGVDTSIMLYQLELPPLAPAATATTRASDR